MRRSINIIDNKINLKTLKMEDLKQFKKIAKIFFLHKNTFFSQKWAPKNQTWIEPWCLKGTYLK